MQRTSESVLTLRASDFARLSVILREHLIDCVNDQARPPASITVVLPTRLMPPKSQSTLRQLIRKPDGRFVELNPRQQMPPALQQVSALLVRLRSPGQPNGPVCHVSVQDRDPDTITVRLHWA